MPEAVIVDAVRTPIGRAFKGSLAQQRPDDMGAFIVDKLLERNPDVSPEMIEEVLCGVGMPQGLQAFNMGRIVSLLSEKLPMGVGGVTISRYCASSLESIRTAANSSDQCRPRGAGDHPGNEEHRHTEVTPAALAQRRRGHDHRGDRGNGQKSPCPRWGCRPSNGSIVPLGGRHGLPQIQLLQNRDRCIHATTDHEDVDRFPRTRLGREARGDEDHRGEAVVFHRHVSQPSAGSGGASS